MTETLHPTYAERRAAMADETRTRILDACVVILARGVAELSIPAVAREARVSVPTVYRNFPDKKTLLHETVQHLRSLRGNPGVPESPDMLGEHVRRHFVQMDSIPETVRAAMVSEPILSVRRDEGTSGRRLEAMQRLLEPALRDAAPRDRELATMMIAVLCSSSTLRAFREVLGASPDQAADVVEWTIARLLAPTEKKPTKGKGTKR